MDLRAPQWRQPAPRPQAAAHTSLEAELQHWRTGAPCRARDWLATALEELAPLARQSGLERWLAPLSAVLQQGNQAMQWLEAHRAGASVAELIAAGAAAMEQRELELNADLATEPPAPLG